MWVCAGTFGIAYALWRLMGGIVINVLKSKSSTFRDRNPVNRTEHGYHVTYMAHAGATIGGYAWLPDVTFSVEGVGGRVNEGGGGGGSVGLRWRGLRWRGWRWRRRRLLAAGDAGSLRTLVIA